MSSEIQSIVAPRPEAAPVLVRPEGHRRENQGAAGNLASILLEAAEMHKLLGVEIQQLQQSVREQRQELADAVEHLPEMKERVNWLIASYYEQSTRHSALEEQCRQLNSGAAELRERMEKLEQKADKAQAPLSEMTRRVEAFTGQFRRQDETISSVAGAVRSLCEVQAHWKTAMDQMVEILLQARSVTLATLVPSLPEQQA